MSDMNMTIWRIETGAATTTDAEAVKALQARLERALGLLGDFCQEATNAGREEDFPPEEYVIGRDFYTRAWELLNED